MAYDLAGRMTRLAWLDGFYVDYFYNVTGEVTLIRENGGTSALEQLATYAYDNLGRRTSLTRGNGTVTTYTYDNVSRPATLSHDFAGTGHDVTWTFTPNPASQIHSVSRDNNTYAWGGHYAVDRGYTANGLNQYSASGSNSLSYTANGNLYSDGTRLYAYTSENRLAAASGGLYLPYWPSGELSEIYRPDDSETLFEYVNGQIITERDDGWAITARYVWGPGVDEALVWYEGNGTGSRHWLHADERGSIVADSNASGSVNTVNSYDEYGIPASTNVGRFQYTGQIWLPELGMYHYRNRVYSPTLGRFLQTDPIGFGGGMNIYGYVLNDPVNYRDPLGLCRGTVMGLVKTTIWGPGKVEQQVIDSWLETRDCHPIVKGATSLTLDAQSGQTTGRLTYCAPVKTRVLQGIIVGFGEVRPGAFGIPIRNGTAAIIYSQFGMSKGELRPHIGGISGLIGGRGAFMGVTDAIGNLTSPVQGMSTSEAFMHLYPDSVILEIMGEHRHNDFENVTFVVPEGVNCPTATGR